MRKRKRSISRAALAAVTVLLLLVETLPCAHASGASGENFEGSGTLIDPWLISSYEDLKELRDRVDSGEDYKGKYFAQTADLTFPDENWNPIGDVKQSLAFRGVYDGCGHVIGNLYSTDQYAGLFSLLGGEVRNLGIESGRISGDTVGGITSHGSGKIINCYNKAAVIGRSRAGGLTDNYSGIILFSWNLGEISGTQESSVLAGITSYGSANIQYSYSLTDPTSERTFKGTLVESSAVREGDIASLLYTIRNLIDTEVPESILYGGVAKMEYVRGALQFGEYVSPEARYLEMTAKRFDFQGEGTEKNPFLITSLEDLKLLRDNVDYGVNYQGYYFAQTEDLFFPDGENWNPIGSVRESLIFSGSYDGRGHTINNIYSQDQNAGLFSYIGGEVRNLGIESGRIEGNCIGGITSHGTGNAIILNCYNKAEIVSTGRGGGLTDNLGSGQVFFSWNLGQVSGINEAVTTAGISSYGSEKIYCSYSTTVEPTDSSTYKGEIENSQLVSEEEIPELLEKQYAAMALQDRQWISRNNIVFLTWRDGSLVFSEEIPSAYSMGILKTYIPVIALLIAVVVFGAALMIVRRKRSRKAANAARTQENSESDIENAQPVSSKVKAKRLLSVMLTLSFFLISSSYAFDILTYDSDNGVQPMKSFAKPENELTDVLFVGNSRISISVDLETLWREYGIAAFWVGAGDSYLPNTYYRLKEACKHHVPSMVIVDISPVAKPEDEVSEANRSANYVGMPISLNKLAYVNATIKNPEQRMDYLLSFPFTHARYSTLGKNDFLNVNIYGKDNKTMGFIFPQLNTVVPKDTTASSQKAIVKLSEKNEYYLRMVIEFCQRIDAQLLLVVPPIFSYHNKIPYFNEAERIAKGYAVPVFDINEYRDVLIPYDVDADMIHLSVTGARKMARYLSEYLKSHYNMPDHRGVVGYESWDRFAAVRENMYLRSITSNDLYFQELARDGQRVVAIPHLLADSASPELQSVLDALGALPHETLESGSLNLDGATLSVAEASGSCALLLNGNSVAQISTPGVILAVWDQYNGELADVTIFSADNAYALRRL